MNDLPALNSLIEPEFQVIAEAIPHIVRIPAPDGSTRYINRQGINFSGLSQDAVRDWNCGCPLVTPTRHGRHGSPGKRQHEQSALSNANIVGTLCALFLNMIVVARS